MLLKYLRLYEGFHYQIDALEEFAPGIREILRQHKIKRQLSANIGRLDLDRILQEMLYPKAVENMDQDIAVNAE